MKNLLRIKKVSFILVLVTLLMVTSNNIFASENKLMEGKSTTLLIPANLDFVINYTSIVKVEESLEFQSWMFNPEEFLEKNNQEFEWEESDLGIEVWMLNVSTFVEDELQIDDWMTNIEEFLPEKYSELPIEDWMLDVNVFLNEDLAVYTIK